jgi:hypothetical protein
MATPQKTDEPTAVERVQTATNNDALTNDEELAIALQSYTPGTDEEKRLVRKIDFVLLPCLWWMYVLAYLDRGNVVSLFRPPPLDQETKETKEN